MPCIIKEKEVECVENIVFYFFSQYHMDFNKKDKSALTPLRSRHCKIPFSSRRVSEAARIKKRTLTANLEKLPSSSSLLPDLHYSFLSVCATLKGGERWLRRGSGGEKVLLQCKPHEGEKVSLLPPNCDQGRSVFLILFMPSTDEHSCGWKWPPISSASFPPPPPPRQMFRKSIPHLFLPDPRARVG